jgi:NADH-quinone oxidoreductase subunit N
VLSSVVAAYYYVRVIKVMYFDEGTETLDQPVFGATRAVAMVAALIVTVFSLTPQPLSLVAEIAAKGLFR